MPFRKFNVTDRLLQMLQDNVEAALKPLFISPLYGPLSLVTDLSLVTGQDNLISHGISKIPSIFLVSYLNANSVIWTQSSSQLGDVNATDRLINIRCSSNCTASLIFG